MLDCPKCKSKSLYWQEERMYDPDTKEMIKGYFSCYVCGKRIYERQENND